MYNVSWVLIGWCVFGSDWLTVGCADPLLRMLFIIVNYYADHGQRAKVVHIHVITWGYPFPPPPPPLSIRTLIYIYAASVPCRIRISHFGSHGDRAAEMISYCSGSCGITLSIMSVARATDEKTILLAASYGNHTLFRQPAINYTLISRGNHHANQ